MKSFRDSAMKKVRCLAHFGDLEVDAISYGGNVFAVVEFNFTFQANRNETY